MQVHIRTLSGNTLSIIVESNSKIKLVKELIFGQIGTKIEDQLLVYEGTELDDDRLLNSYSKTDQMTIELRMSVNLQRKLSKSQAYIDEYGYSDNGCNIIY